MALPASPDSISFDQIRTEFGTPSGKNLGAYRVSETYGQLTNLPLDSGIPQSGTIKFSDFYSKKLNVIVDYYSSATATTGETAKTTYNNNGVNIVGGNSGITRSKPTNTSGKKIITHVNRLIGSTKGNRNYCALKTGSWDGNTELILNIGTAGELYGAGGDGGTGGIIYGGGEYAPGNGDSQSPPPGSSGGGNGTDGSSALGIEYPISIINNGTIFGGRGGGGGGGNGHGYSVHDVTPCKNGRDYPYISGGGGAGGQGYPAGLGGNAGSGYGRLGNKGIDVLVSAGAGTNGTTTTNGTAGTAGSAQPDFKCGGTTAVSGTGGGIESAGETKNYLSGGNAGARGYAYIISSTGSLISFSGNAIQGDFLNPGTVS